MTTEIAALLICVTVAWICGITIMCDMCGFNRGENDNYFGL